MKIYRIQHEVDVFQGIDLVADENGNQPFLTFDCLSLADSWRPPAVYSLYPKRRTPDFWRFWGGNGTLVTGPSTTEKVRDFYQIAGEMLPLPFKSEIFTVLNVLECIDCLDYGASRWPTESKEGRPSRYAFHEHRLTSSIFKIPETCRAEIFALERSGDRYDEFKAFVEAEQLTGLRFDLVWSTA